MAIKRVTMQDIADACGLSRNTVSKVFNGRASVPQATRMLILQKAEELGYGLPGKGGDAFSSRIGGSIALLTNKLPRDAHFGTNMLSSMSDNMSRAGYTLRIFEVSADETRAKRLPPFFDRDKVAGIVAIELFDADYLDMVCGLGIPTISVDGPRTAISTLMNCDFISMENIASMIAVVQRLAGAGAKSIGFVGDREHCSSFYERWYAFGNGLQKGGLPLDESLCILAPDSAPYGDPEWLMRQVGRMPELPDAFVCANDYLGIQMMTALKRMGLSIPRDVMVTGFDGTSQSALVDPPLTTVKIPGDEIGLIAAKHLLNRIQKPGMPYGWTRIRTTPVWRGSIREK